MRLALPEAAHPVQVDLHRQEFEVIKLRHVVRLAVEVVGELVNDRVDHLRLQHQHRVQRVQPADHAELQKVRGVHEIVHDGVKVDAVARSLSDGVGGDQHVAHVRHIQRRHLRRELHLLCLVLDGGCRQVNVGDCDTLQPLAVQAVNGAVLVGDEDVEVDAELDFRGDDVQHLPAVLVVLLIRPDQRLVALVLVGLEDFVDGRLLLLQRPDLHDASASVVR